MVFIRVPPFSEIFGELEPDSVGIGIVFVQQSISFGVLPERNLYVLHFNVQRLIRRYLSQGGFVETGKPDVFKNQFLQNGSFLQQGGFRLVIQQMFQIFDQAIPEYNVPGRFIRIHIAGEIIYQSQHVVPTGFPGQNLVPVFHDGDSVGIITGTIDVAVFYQNVYTTNAESIAGTVDFAVSDD
jgi:hypothetical protein